MNKAKINYINDMTLAILLSLSFVTGVIKWPGIVRYFALTRALPLGTITFIHDWAGLIMGIAIFVHLALHRKWIVCMTKSLFKGGKKCDS